MSAPHDDPDAAPRAPQGDELGFALPPPATLSRARGAVFALLGVGVLAGAFAAGYLPRRRARAALEQQTRAAVRARPRVRVVTPRAGASSRALVLPGSVRPLEEALIYARASGYVRSWHADLGDRVREGQLLAQLETPELDHEIAQARAQLAQAQAAQAQAAAGRDLAAADLARQRQLASGALNAPQDLERSQAQAAGSVAGLGAAQATVNAQRANIQRLMQLKSFARVTAPFAGTIAARSVERGALVTAGANSTALFRLVATDPVRVMVQVPQDVAAGVRAGLAARVTVREHAGRVFAGQVARTAGALDPATRTMTTEVRVPNGDGALLAGMYAEVALTLPAPRRVWEVPGTAVMSDARGVRVAVVDEDDRVRLVPVVIERDTGNAVQIASGLAGDERVVRIASVELGEGTQVEVAPEPR